MKVTPLFSFVIFSWRSFAVTWQGDTAKGTAVRRGEGRVSAALAVSGTQRHGASAGDLLWGVRQAGLTAHQQAGLGEPKLLWEEENYTTLGSNSSPAAQETWQRNLQGLELSFLKAAGLCCDFHFTEKDEAPLQMRPTAALDW